MNTNLAAHPAFRGARLSGGLGMTGGDAVTKILPFTTIDYDDDDYFVTLSRFKIPPGLAGRYRARASALIQANNNVSRWHATLELFTSAGSVYDELHVAAGLVADANSTQMLEAEGTFQLAEGAIIQAALTGQYFPAVVADFQYQAHALELHYLGRA